MSLTSAAVAVTLYGRSYCSLCTQMREQLQAGWSALTVQWVDIDDSPELEQRYGEWVPVLVGADGDELCHYRLDAAALDAYLGNFR